MSDMSDRAVHEGTTGLHASRFRERLESLPIYVRGLLAREIDAQRGRLILWCPVFLAGGIGWYFSLPGEPDFQAQLLALAAFMVFWPVLRPRREYGEFTFLTYIFVTLGLIFMAGMVAAQARTILVKSPMLAKELAPVSVEGRIIAADLLEDEVGLRLTLDRLQIDRLAPAQTPWRVRLKVRQAGTLRVGDRIRVLAGLSPPSPPVAPGAFDYQQYSYFHRIGASGFTYRAPEILATGDKPDFLQSLERMRDDMRETIRRAVAGPATAIVTALMTGERAAIAEADNEALRVSGLYHMLSISGLHVGLVAGFIFIGLRTVFACLPWVSLRFPIKKGAALAALLGIAAYTVIVGGSVPTVRSAIMTGVVLFAVMVDRTPFSMRLVALAAFILLIIVPESLISASFQMSFAAVAALIFFYESFRDRLATFYRNAGMARRVMVYFAGVCLTTVIATLATAPFSLFHFQQLSVYGLIANFFAMPLMAFIVMPASVISYILMPLGLAAPALAVMAWGVDMIMLVARAVASLPLATYTPPAFPLHALPLFACGGVFMMLWNGNGRLAGLLPVFVALAAIAMHQQPLIQVDGGGRLVSLRDENGRLWLNDRRVEKFAAENWARRNGVRIGDVGWWRDHPDIMCDEMACRAHWAGKNISYSILPGGQVEECAWADIIIAREPMRAAPCASDIIVDFFDLWRNGAHTIDGSGSISTVAQGRGVRPWVVSNSR